MDAEDTRIAQERIDHAASQLAALTTQGLDTSGLASQLDFARGSLRDGRTLDVLAICEEILLSAKRLKTGSPARVRTDRHAKPSAAPEPSAPKATENYPSGIYAQPGAEAVDRQRLTEEIRQAVQGDLMPKALSSAQLHDRINKSVAKAFAEHLAGFRAELDERFQRLAATPETKQFARAEADPPAIDVPALMSDFEQRLDARTSSIARSTALAIAEATAGIEQRLAHLGDPDRLRQQIRSTVDDAVREGLAAIDLQHQESAARHAVADAEDAARDRATLNRVAATVDQLDTVIATQVATAMAGATEAITAPIRELVSEVLAKSATPDLDAISQKLTHELRADLDWQVERLAAERGWVSIADVQAEVTRANGQGGTAAAPPVAFARLEAALVEFVHQSQLQQQQFLGVLQQRVEHSAEVVTKNLARAFADEHRSSALFRSPATGADTALEARATNAADHELDVLSQTAQHRAIEGFSVPPPQGTAAFVPGTVAVTRQTAQQIPATAVTMKTLRETAVAPAAEGESQVAREAERDVESAAESAVEREAAGESPTPDELGEIPVETAPSAPEPTASEASPLDDASSEAQPTTSSIPMAAHRDQQDALESTTPPTTMTSAVLAAGDHEAGATATTPRAPSTAALTAPMIESAAESPTEPTTRAQATEAAPQTQAPAAESTTTSRSSTLEAGLRRLVRSEIERQLNGSLRDTLRQALGLEHPPVTPAVLAAHVEEALTKAMAERELLSGTNLAPTEASDGPRSALTMPWAPGPHGREELRRLLRDPTVRQEVLGIVAVEVLANPGALAELSGIRAFIRTEVGNAAKEIAALDHPQHAHGLHGDPALT